MKTIRYFVSSAVTCVSACVLWATEPVVSDVKFVQESDSATISYVLSGAPAIVLVDFEKNGESVGAFDPAELRGDHSGAFGNVIYPSETRKKIKWWPSSSSFKLEGEVKAVIRAWSVDAPPDIMVVDLKTGTRQYFNSTNSVPGVNNVQDDVYKTSKMVFKRIPAGGVKWRMGTGGVTSGNETAHMVTLTRDFYLGIYECTQAQFAELKPGVTCAVFTTQGAKRPCDSISYTTIRGATNWPNDDPLVAHGVGSTSFMGILRSRADNLQFDLPTEAQWQYACRGGSLDLTYLGDYSDVNVSKIARYGSNSGKSATGDKVPTDCDPSQGTAIVGSYLPNSFGLYDMLGNVLERCLDRFAAFTADEVTDPVGETSLDVIDFSVCGGCWRDPRTLVYATARNGTRASDTYQSRGFRVALELPREYECTSSATLESTSIDVPTRVAASEAYSDLTAIEDVVGEASVSVPLLDARRMASAESEVLPVFSSMPVAMIIFVR